MNNLELKLFYGMLFIAVVALTVGSIYGPKQVKFSPLQPVESMQREYNACKEKAPKGFDCYMIPILVSEDYIKGNQ